MHTDAHLISRFLIITNKSHLEVGIGSKSKHFVSVGAEDSHVS